MRYEIRNTKYETQKGFTRTPKTWVSGFTILESIVAIAVLSLSISGVFSSVQQSLSQSIIAKDEVKAFYLAQEAVEIIRHNRDSNQLTKIITGSGTWLAGIAQNSGDPCWFGNTCRVDVASPNLAVQCGNSTNYSWDACPLLNQDQTTFLYGYDGSDPATNFTREIQLERIRDDIYGNPVEIAVIVRVKWTKGLLITREFKAKTYLLNWR